MPYKTGGAAGVSGSLDGGMTDWYRKNAALQQQDMAAGAAQMGTAAPRPTINTGTASSPYPSSTGINSTASMQALLDASTPVTTMVQQQTTESMQQPPTPPASMTALDKVVAPEVDKTAGINLSAMAGGGAGGGGSTGSVDAGLVGGSAGNLRAMARRNPPQESMALAGLGRKAY
jgi:hypothetical protein